MDERFNNADLIDDQSLDPLKQECNDYTQQRKVLTQASLVERVPQLLDANKLQILVNAANKHHSHSDEGIPQYSTEEVIQLYQESFKETLDSAAKQINKTLAKHHRVIDYLQVQLALLTSQTKSQEIEQAFKQNDSVIVKQWQDDVENVVEKLQTYQKILQDCYSQHVIPEVGNNDELTLLDPCEKFTQNMPICLDFSGGHNSRLVLRRSERILRHAPQNRITLIEGIEADIPEMIPESIRLNSSPIHCEEVWDGKIMQWVCELLNQKLVQNVKK